MSILRLIASWGLEMALERHPGLTFAPSTEEAVTLAGSFTFEASTPGLESISDTYEIAIQIPLAFPRAVPRVYETSGRIDRKFHRLSDGAFCLGSPAQLRLRLVADPTILGFIERCIVPYLYGYSFLERHGRLPFGELEHGDPGLIHDFERLFAVSGPTQCAAMLSLAGMKKRVANKRPCPCGAGKRVGKCHHLVINCLRPKLGRAWCRAQAQWITEEYAVRPEAEKPVQKLAMAAVRAKRRKKDPERRVETDAGSDVRGTAENALNSTETGRAAWRAADIDRPVILTTPAVTVPRGEPAAA